MTGTGGPIAPGPQRASDGALDRRSGAGGGTLKHARRTGLILVALPETPPVSEAASLEQDLRQAQIEPWAWGINRAMVRTGTTDPLLQRRIASEAVQIARVHRGLSRRRCLLPFSPDPLVGVSRLLALSRVRAIRAAWFGWLPVPPCPGKLTRLRAVSGFSPPRRLRAMSCPRFRTSPGAVTSGRVRPARSPGAPCRNRHEVPEGQDRQARLRR